ncbi:MAG: hypothetical protein ACI8S6_000274 [Myxococcota bacterium]|jgi:hypothetical protein
MSTAEADTPAKPPLKQRLNALMEEYGRIAIFTWLTIFVLTLSSFVVAIKFGYTPDGAAGQSGIVVIAYVATQATKPIRIFATLALTPVIAKLIRR